MTRSALTAFIAASLAFAGNPHGTVAHVDRDLAASSQAESDILVVYHDDDDDDSRNRREGTFRAHGGKNTRHHRSAGMSSLRANKALVEQLKNDPKVRSISLDRRISAAASYPFDPDEARMSVQLSGTSRGSYPGTKIGVAVIDSGVSGIDALRGGTSCASSRIVYNQNFTSDTGTADLFGHGTHVASILGADSNCDSTGYPGVAPEVNIINLRVLNESGIGTDSSVIAAIDYAIKLKSTYNIRVMNLSLGRSVSESYATDPLCQAVEKAWKAGIVVVVAAGNLGRYPATQGYGTVAAPGNDPYVITVGAVRSPDAPDSRTYDTIASYSSKGPTAIDHIVKPDMVAPGNLMVARTVFPSMLAKMLPGDVCYDVRPAVHEAERNQHGNADGVRNRGHDDPEGSQPHSGPGEGAADEDGLEGLRGHGVDHRFGHRHLLPGPARPVHRGRRLPGRRHRALLHPEDRVHPVRHVPLRQSAGQRAGGAQHRLPERHKHSVGHEQHLGQQHRVGQQRRARE